uniref:M20_dimer domain-containing protein n=1 Tax=Meloidogyne hapla TaxID=6305 RepID=A0A1I8BS11_MELHA
MTENIAVTKFREFLRINTEQPKPDYYGCKDFLFNYAKELNITPWAYECVDGKPFIGMTLFGIKQELPSILLYCHTDVVPTFAEHWKYPPYEAFKDNDGNIFARGAQDMKCVGVQYLEALRVLKASNENKPFVRTINILWGPDEEIGGHDGMEKFVETDFFKQLKVGFVLDEGLASENDVYRLFYAERCVWWFKIICPGSPGHGSRFIENSAGPKLTSILQSVNEFREKQRKKLEENSDKLNLGDVTSINLTKVEGGVQTNVIPSEFVACKFNTLYF